MTLNLDALNVLDGFSVVAPMLFRLGGGGTWGGSERPVFGARIDAATLRPSAAGDVPFSEVSLAVSVDVRRSHTLVVEVGSGEVVAHWAEADVSEDEWPRGTLVVLQPAQALRNSAHYVVAVRRVRDVTGEIIGRSPAFDQLVRRVGVVRVGSRGRCEFVWGGHKAL